MKFNRKHALLLVGGAAAAGLLVGTASVALAAGGSFASDHSAAHAQQLDPSTEQSGFSEQYPVNENGQTYGTFSVGDPEPDLVPAATDDGKPGYIYVSDLEWAPASNPDEAVKIMRKHVNDKGEIIVPVYELDGKTKIGTFTAGTVDSLRDDGTQ